MHTVSSPKYENPQWIMLIILHNIVRDSKMNFFLRIQPRRKDDDI